MLSSRRPGVFANSRWGDAIGRRASARGLDCPPAAPPALFLGLGLRCLISGRITGRFVALTPPGILVGTRRRPTLLPWADFDQLTDQRGVPKLRLHASETLVPLEDIFASAQELADFRSALHAAAQRYRATRPGRAPLPRTPEDWRP